MRLKSSLKFYRRLLFLSITKFFKEYSLIQSAALAFYTIFSLPSILLIVLWIAGQFNKENVVREAIFYEVGGLVGHTGAQQLIGTVQKIHIHEPTLLATVVGVCILIFTSTNVFFTIQISLNRIFEVEPVKVNRKIVWWKFKERVVYFSLIITISFLSLLLVGMEVLIRAAGKTVSSWVGNEVSNTMVTFDISLIDFLLTTILIALIYRHLPKIKLNRKDVVFGAFMTSTLLMIGELLISFFIGRNPIANLYEAAGSILVLMLWIYYASAIFLFGATLTFVRSKLIRGKI